MNQSPSKCPSPDNPGNGEGLRTDPPAGTIPFTEQMLEEVQTGVIFIDSGGVIRRANALARQDLRADDVKGRSLPDLFSIVHQEEDLFAGILARLNAGETEPIKLPAGTLIRHSNKKYGQFFISGSFLRIAEKEYLFSFRNITDEVTREHILSMVLARTKIFPWFYDMSQDKMLIDPHWFAYLGIPAGDCMITREEFFDRVHPDEREMLAEALRRQLSETEIPDIFYYRLRHADGRWEWFSEQSMYLSRMDDGSPYRVVGVCQSIQEHKTTEQSLREAWNKAQESDRLKSAFLANMSHEIRTPLNAIVGFSNLFAQGDIEVGSEEAREYGALIRKSCDNLLTLVSDVLDLSRMETETMEYAFAEVDSGKFLTDIYEKFRDRMPRAIRFNLLLPPNAVKIETDIQRLRQVIGHLLDNAIKFTEEGKIDLGYTLPAGGGYIRLFVADTGRGIPDDETDRIFDRFHKIDTFTQGAGLGLSVCKTITEGLGGRIGVKSRPGEGSLFSLTLPLHPHTPESRINSTKQ